MTFSSDNKGNSHSDIVYSIEINGIEDKLKQIAQFSDKLQSTLLRRAIALGGNYLKKKAKAIIPVRSGRMKNAIAFKKSRINSPRRNGSLGYYLTAKRGRFRRDPKGAFYAFFVEHGTYKIEPREFMQKTFDAHAKTASDLIIHSIDKGSDQLIKKINL